MKVVIVDAFERENRGDAALLSVAIHQVLEAFPQASISIAGFEDPVVHPHFDDQPNIGSIRRYVGEEDVARRTRVLRKAVAALVAVTAGLPRPRSHLQRMTRSLPADMRREVDALINADLVLALGGGYLNAKADVASDLSIALLLLPMWIAERCDVPVVLAPQSYGPFPRPQQRAILRRVLGAARTVVARESISVARLSEAGLPLRNVTRGVDSAFAFRGRSQRPWRDELGIEAGKRLVLITARRHLKPAQQEIYERAMAQAIRHLVRNHQCSAVLVPQVTCAFQDDDDRLVNARIAEMADEPGLHLLDDDTIDHHDVFALYGAADLILGTRFHSVIFGLCSRVPCLAIEYDHKTRGIMNDLGLGRWVIPMADVRTELLTSTLDELMAERGRYSEHLAAVLPSYTLQAEEFVDTLRDAVQHAKQPA
jgi:polysaccharide pyruvyl transferase WcaK-like protein